MLQKIINREKDEVLFIIALPAYIVQLQLTKKNSITEVFQYWFCKIALFKFGKISCVKQSCRSPIYE